MKSYKIAVKPEYIIIGRDSDFSESDFQHSGSQILLWGDFYQTLKRIIYRIEKAKEVSEHFDFIYIE